MKNEVGSTAKDTQPMLDPADARRFYEDRANRWRNPFGKCMHNGINLEGQRFRGIRAGMHVRNTKPMEIDEEGNRVLETKAQILGMMSLGLSEIEGSGLLPLSDEFLTGYGVLTDLVARELED